MMQEVQCKMCRRLEQITDEEFYCAEKGKNMNGVSVTAIRNCGPYQPRENEEEEPGEKFGDEIQADYKAGFLMPMGAVRLPEEKVTKAREAIQAKVEEKRKFGKEPLDKNIVAQFRPLYESGIGSDEIGKRLGVSGNCVRKYLKAAGVKLRPASKTKGSHDKPHKRVSNKKQNVSQMTQLESTEPIIGPGAAIGMEQLEVAPKIIVTDDEPELDLPPHLRVSAEALVKSIDEHNAKQPRFHCAEDNLEEFLREYFGNLTPRRLYQLPEHIREAADKLTRALFEGRAA